MELAKNNSRIVNLKNYSKLKSKQINWSVGGWPKKINLALAFGIQRVQISVDKTIGGIIKWTEVSLCQVHFEYFWGGRLFSKLKCTILFHRW